MIDTAENMRKLPCIGPFSGENCKIPKCPAAERHVEEGCPTKYARVLYYCGLSFARTARRHPEPDEEPVNIVELDGEK